MKYTKLELQRALSNMVDDRPMQLTPAKIKALTKVQNDISSGRLKTLDGIRTRVKKTRLK